ncbi:DUF2470 domain-containing protein [Helicobacter felis]|uniref:DUF2470 domain-containing protein n=1 Tax=Helicobacter felis TaxID=214 RepID=UPI000CF0B260|nr:DUF2470 domain-containing protein [Helicobacter felis]
MDKKHAMEILNSKQLVNLVKLLEKEGVQNATEVQVQDLNLTEMKIAYSKEGKQEVLTLKFPKKLENFEGIRDALISMLGIDAQASQEAPHAQGFQNADPNAHFGAHAGNFQGQMPFNQHGPAQGFNHGFGAHQGQQPHFGPQAGGFQGQMPFNQHGPAHGFNHAGFGMPFHGFPPVCGMFVWGFVPFYGFPMGGFQHHHAHMGGFSPMGNHAHMNHFHHMGHPQHMGNFQQPGQTPHGRGDHAQMGGQQMRGAPHAQAPASNPRGDAPQGRHS